MKQLYPRITASLISVFGPNTLQSKGFTACQCVRSQHAPYRSQSLAPVYIPMLYRAFFPSPFSPPENGYKAVFSPTES